MQGNSRPEGWIDFEEVKKTVPFDVVLSELGLMDRLRCVGDEIRGTCPICGGERSFSANPVKGLCNCFRCKKGGDVIDFVAALKDIKKRQAAEWLVSLAPPVKEQPEQHSEGENALPAMGLTPREVRLLHIIARTNARCVAAMFSSSFARVVEQLEDMSRQIVNEEMYKEFPDTAFPEEGE
jgi:hypothetical protein